MRDAHIVESPPAPRVLGAVNWLGLWTLYLKEVRRFLKVHFQTVAAPVVTTLLFLAVFALALGSEGRMIGGVPFTEFLAPGLIMMAMVQNAFANTSSTITISKNQGNIVDVLMPPLAAWEQALAFSMGGVSRGLLVGIVVGAAMWIFVPIHIEHPVYVIYHGFMACLMLSFLGLMGGIWADKFDHMAAVTNFVVTPLSFLSGTFYSVERLPEGWHLVAHLNPFFYMIDGFRYGMIGHADGSLMAGAVIVLLVNAVLGYATYWMFDTGYKLKA